MYGNLPVPCPRWRSPEGLSVVQEGAGDDPGVAGREFGARNEHQSVKAEKPHDIDRTEGLEWTSSLRQFVMWFSETNSTCNWSVEIRLASLSTVLARVTRAWLSGTACRSNSANCLPSG